MGQKAMPALAVAKIRNFDRLYTFFLLRIYANLLDRLK